MRTTTALITSPDLTFEFGRQSLIDATIISALEQVVFGVLMIVFMIYEPLGMAKLWENFKQRIFKKK